MLPDIRVRTKVNVETCEKKNYLLAFPFFSYMDKYMSPGSIPGYCDGGWFSVGVTAKALDKKRLNPPVGDVVNSNR